METIFLVAIFVAMLAVFGLDAAQKRRQFLGSE
jgi:hypothetical protein